MKVLFTITFTLFVSLTVSANESIPNNAHKTPYSISGKNWVCDTGFYEDNNQCLHIPENAQPKAYALFGRKWDCKTGFYLSNKSECLPLKLPKNSSQSYTNSNSWKCNHGFERNGAECTPVVIPDNARLRPAFAYGILGNKKPWECNSGFYPKGNECVKLSLPENSHQSYPESSSWSCDRGYEKNANACTAITIPDNATLNYLGSGWTCNSNFKKSDSECIPLSEEEIAQNKAQVEKLLKAYREKRQRLETYGPSGSSCQTEYTTGAEVCLGNLSARLRCNESYLGNYYDTCYVYMDYTIETNHRGSSDISVSVDCSATISHTSPKDYISGSKSGYSSDTHYVSSYGTVNAEQEMYISFGYLDEPTEVRIKYSTCDITSANL